MSTPLQAHVRRRMFVAAGTVAIMAAVSCSARAPGRSTGPEVSLRSAAEAPSSAAVPAAPVSSAGLPPVPVSLNTLPREILGALRDDLVSQQANAAPQVIKRSTAVYAAMRATFQSAYGGPGIQATYVSTGGPGATYHLLIVDGIQALPVIASDAKIDYFGLLSPPDAVAAPGTASTHCVAEPPPTGTYVSGADFTASDVRKAVLADKGARLACVRSSVGRNFSVELTSMAGDDGLPTPDRAKRMASEVDAVWASALTASGQVGDTQVPDRSTRPPIPIDLTSLPGQVLGNTRSDLWMQASADAKMSAEGRQLSNVYESQVASYVAAYGGPGIEATYGAPEHSGQSYDLLIVNSTQPLPIVKSDAEALNDAVMGDMAVAVAPGTRTTRCVVRPTELTPVQTDADIAAVRAQALDDPSSTVTCVRSDRARNLSIRLVSQSGDTLSARDQARSIASEVDNIWKTLPK